MNKALKKGQCVQVRHGTGGEWIDGTLVLVSANRKSLLVSLKEIELLSHAPNKGGMCTIGDMMPLALVGDHYISIFDSTVWEIVVVESTPL